MNDGFELWGALHPGVHQLHGRVEVLHVFAIHLQEGSEFLEDVPDPRVYVPEKKKVKSRRVKLGSLEDSRYYLHMEVVPVRWGGRVGTSIRTFWSKCRKWLDKTFFLTQHCGIIQRLLGSLGFSPRLGLSRSYTISVLSHSRLLWLCLNFSPLYVLSPPSLSPPFLHLSVSLPHHSLTSISTRMLCFLPYFQLQSDYKFAHLPVKQGRPKFLNILIWIMHNLI